MPAISDIHEAPGILEAKPSQKTWADAATKFGAGIVKAMIVSAEIDFPPPTVPKSEQRVALEQLLSDYKQRRSDRAIKMARC